MATLLPTRAFSRSIRQIHKPCVRLTSLQARAAASTSGFSKHPEGFVPPTQEDLDELQERVQEFTRREISEELAQKTDRVNEFPNEMWRKFGEAG